MSRSSVVVSLVEQLAQDFGFASQEGRNSIGRILSWSLHAMTEAPESPSVLVIPAPLDPPPVVFNRVDDVTVSAAMRAPDPIARQTRPFQDPGIHHFLARI
jgi:hypothetical protein